MKALKWFTDSLWLILSGIGQARYEAYKRNPQGYWY